MTSNNSQKVIGPKAANINNGSVTTKSSSKCHIPTFIYSKLLFEVIKLIVHFYKILHLLDLKSIISNYLHFGLHELYLTSQL